MTEDKAWILEYRIGDEWVTSCVTPGVGTLEQIVATGTMNTHNELNGYRVRNRITQETFFLETLMAMVGYE